MFFAQKHPIQIDVVIAFLPDPIEKQLVDDLKVKIILFEKITMFRMKYYIYIHIKALSWYIAHPAQISGVITQEGHLCRKQNRVGLSFRINNYHLLAKY